MAIPEQEVKNFDFSGGFNTELGLVNTDSKVAKNLENVELKADGSAERRSGFAMLEDTLIDSEALDVTGNRSSAGWVYPAPSLFIWRKTEGTEVKDFAILGGVSEGVTANRPVYDLKELTNGLADLENWSTSSGIEVENQQSGAVSAPVFKSRYTPMGDMLMINHPHFSPHVIVDVTDTATNLVAMRMRDPNDNTVDSLVKNNNVAYQCIVDHTSGSGSEPGVGSVWTQFWKRIGGAVSEPAWVTSTVYGSNVDLVNNVISGGASLAAGEGFTHAAFVGGRAWYTGHKSAPATVFVTQPLRQAIPDADTVAELGHCFSVNDPHSVLDSSRTAADGGTIVIREAGTIKSMTVFREGIILFATNGVWAIPNAGNFNATSFDVLKISDVPITSPDAFAVTDAGVIYFGVNAIQNITITDNGNLVSQEISGPIRTFYNSISEYSKDTSFVCYNRLEQRVYWFTTFVEPTYATGEGPYRTVNFNKQPCAAQDILVYDLKLGAFYKYQTRKGVDLTDNDLMFADCATIIGDFGEEANIINLAGDNIINAASDNIVSSSFDGTNIQEHMIMLVTNKKTISAGNDVFRYGFAHFKGDITQDFDNLVAADDDLKHTFDSEILSQQFIFEDVGHNKQAPYVHTIYRRVETGILDAGGDDLTPGGCLLQFRFNWATGPKAGPQFGTPFQSYVPQRWNINPNDGSLPDIEVVLNRHKIQGRGRAFQVRFTNDGTKRFHLLGYQLEVEATRKV